MKMEPLDLETVAVDPVCAVRIPAQVALRRLVLPLAVLDGVLHVAMADATDAGAREAVRGVAGCDVAFHAADPAQLRAALLKLYGDGRTGGGLATGAAPVAGAAEDPVALVDGILRAAMLRHASDVHFDPDATGVRVRFRTDGELEEVRHIPAALQAGVTSRLKVMAGLDIAERRAPQDGAFTWRAPGGANRLPPLDIRMATLPVRHGERVTLRLLETDGARLTLDGLGLASGDRTAFGEVLDQPHGLVLLTGPTGSGKTTTLYAAIRLLLERHPLNVLTVEDPIEYEIPGVSQAEVDASDKVNFAKALRSLLRHDPDVIMIGEVRDAESLDTAVKAALTGHLVLSTLHTNDAVSAVTRLSDMGLEAHLAAATLRLVVAQRLVRALCPRCRERVDAGFRAKGCLACAGRGFKGRLGLFELFLPDAEISSLIARGAPADEIRSAARAKGMRTLADDAAEKCRAGLTTLAEAVRATGSAVRI